MTKISHTAAAECAARADGPCEFGPPQRFPDRSGLVEGANVIRCRHCGMGITNPPLSDVAFLYEGRGSQDFQPLATGLARRIKTIAFRREARKLLAQVGGMPKRVLDFGCGSGLFTRCLSDLLTANSVVGSDFHAEPPGELADRPYVPNAALAGQAGSFDLVLVIHVLEHDDDPVALLERLRALGNDNCTFVIEVPNVDCIWAHVFGQAWDAWYLPFHRTHFNRASLVALMERSGFDVLRVVDATIPSMGRSLANLARRRNTLGFLMAGVILHPIQWIGERLTRRPSALRIIAKAQA